MMRSSARRDRCVPIIVAVKSSSATKSRSLTASIEFGEIAREAEAALQQDARDRIRAARDGAGAERKHAGRALRGAQARAIALERPEVRQQPVRAGDRNGALHVRVRRHERRLEAVRLIDHHAAADARTAASSRVAASIDHRRVAVAT